MCKSSAFILQYFVIADAHHYSYRFASRLLVAENGSPQNSPQRHAMKESFLFTRRQEYSDTDSNLFPTKAKE